MKSRKTMILSILLVVCFILGLSSCANSNKQSATAVKEAESLMDKYVAAWQAEDPAALIPLLADDIIGFDSLEKDWSFNKQDAVEMVEDPDWWDKIKLGEKSIFVSSDGKYAVNMTTMTFYFWDRGTLPNAHIVAMSDGKIIFSYDYYGASLSETEPLPTFDLRTVEPGSDEAMKMVEQSTTTVKKWQKAYNERNTKDYLSCYAENVKYIDAIKPDWRILTKSQLSADIDTNFSRTAFLSRLEASASSPIPNGFFVSPDGHYAAVQGIYEDTEKVSAKPMAVILELREGKIVKQYNFMNVDFTSL